VYSTVTANSAEWENAYTALTGSSGLWNSVYSSVTANSSDWNNAYTALTGSSGLWNSVYSTVTANSGEWENAYTALTGSSGLWNSVYSTVTANSAEWESAYTTLTGNSSTWATKSYVGTNFVHISGGDTITGGLSVQQDFVVKPDFAPGNTPILFVSYNDERVGINTKTPLYPLHVNGDISGATGYFTHIAANTKSFYINHPDPAKSNKHLQYGSLESPYHGIRLTGDGYITGKNAKIVLPDYIPHLIRLEDISIQLTNFKHNKQLWVDDVVISANPFNSYFIVAKKNNIFDNKTYKFFWSFTAIRKDIPHLQTEV
jgi:hypothetical protein